MTTHFWAVPPIGTPAIQIDIDAEALGRNYPLQACVNGDAKVDARAHARACRPQASAAKRDAWVAEVQAICRDWLVQVQAGARLRRGADPPRAHLRTN